MIVIPKYVINVNTLKNDVRLMALAQAKPVPIPAVQFDVCTPKAEERTATQSPKK